MATKVTETVRPNPLTPEQTAYNQQAIDANTAWLGLADKITPSILAGIESGASAIDLANTITRSIGAFSDQAAAIARGETYFPDWNAPVTDGAVRQLYQEKLGREPTQQDIDYWKTNPNIQAAADNIGRSPEAASYAAPRSTVAAPPAWNDSARTAYNPLAPSGPGNTMATVADWSAYNQTQGRTQNAAPTGPAPDGYYFTGGYNSGGLPTMAEGRDPRLQPAPGVGLAPPAAAGVGLAPPASQVSATPPPTFQSAPYNPTADYELIANASDTAITAGQKDIDRFFGDAMKVLNEQATARGMRFRDSPMLDRGGQIATDVLRQKEDLAQGIRAQQASMNLSYPLEKYTTLSNVGVNEGRLGLDAWKGAQQVDQFGRSLGQQESQFGRSLALDRWTGEQQVDQFGRSLGQQESQFGRSLGFDRLSLAQAAEQFNSTMGLNNRTLSADVAQRGIENRLAGANALMDRYNFGVNSGLNLINATRPNAPQFPDTGSTGTSRTSGSSTSSLLGGAGALLQGVGALTSGGGIVSGIKSLFGSARDTKDVHEDVLPEMALAGVMQTPVSKWSYKGENTNHIGPMAEDFQRAFGVGDGKTISIIDAIGVLFASVQALAEKQRGMIHANR